MKYILFEIFFKVINNISKIIEFGDLKGTFSKYLQMKDYSIYEIK